MAEQLACTVGVIGAGSMGGAVARGLAESDLVAPGHVLACDHHADKLAALEAAGVRACATAEKLAGEKPDVLVLAVKPQVLSGVMATVAPSVEGTLVVSIAAGIPTAALEAALPGARVVRAMPNLPVQVRSGATAVCAGATATADDVELVRTLFSALGAVSVMREDQLDVESAVVGTAPAFFSLFVNALTKAGVKAGLPAAACRELVEATMRGCAEQLLVEGVHPCAYAERVTSPGGTTAAAVYELEPHLLEGSYAAVEAALARTRELADS